MALSHLPASAAYAFEQLARWLDRRTAGRLPLLMLGIPLASRRRAVTSWSRAAGIAAEFRKSYVAACAVGRPFEHTATDAARAVKPLLGRKRLLLAIGDTHVPRYGPRSRAAASTTTLAPVPSAGSTSTATSG